MPRQTIMEAHMHQEIHEKYHQLRAKGVPALYAWRIANAPRVESLEWTNGNARWNVDGYQVVASILNNQEDADLSYLDVQERDYFDELRQLKIGMVEARDLARQYAANNHQRVTDFGSQWWMVGVHVTATRCGVVLGSASLWGIESDSDTDFFTETARDLAVEAVDMAESTRTRLCS